MEEEQVHLGSEGEHVSHESVERLRSLLGSTRVAMLTTYEGRRGLRSRPMLVQEITDDGEAWLFTDGASPKVDEIAREHHVNLGFHRPVLGRWISVSGRATVVRDRDKIRALWHPMLLAWFPKGLENPDLCLVRMKIDEAESWDTPFGNIRQVARAAGSLLGRAEPNRHVANEPGRERMLIRTRQYGVGDTAGILGTAGGSMGEAPAQGEPPGTRRRTTAKEPTPKAKAPTPKAKETARTKAPRAKTTGKAAKKPSVSTSTNVAEAKPAGTTPRTPSGSTTAAKTRGTKGGAARATSAKATGTKATGTKTAGTKTAGTKTTSATPTSTKATSTTPAKAPATRGSKATSAGTSTRATKTEPPEKTAARPTTERAAKATATADKPESDA